jgi:hypothetical protein
MSSFSPSRRCLPNLGRVFLAAAGLAVASPVSQAGTWTKIVHNAPQPVNLMLLMSDGTVMCARNNGSTISNGWMRLTPDATGSYVNGTWTTLANAHDTRLYYPSQVLRDGRVFVAGGEYGTGGPRAEVYDPATNVWTTVTPPAGLWNVNSNSFYDCNSEMTPDGRVLLMPVFPNQSGVALRYDPATNTWSKGGKLAVGSFQDEATWVKLRDDTILTVDPFGTHSERYSPPTNTWINDGTVPVALYDPFGSELGYSLLFPDGRAFFLGSTGHTAIYTPTGTTAPGTWAAGIDIPSGKGTPDAPAAMMVTGNILCAVSPKATSGNHFPTPTTFYEYDWTTNTFAPEPAPVGAQDNVSTYMTAMLDLPDGSVMYSHFGNDVYVYTPTGAPLAQGKPTITSITTNLDGTFHLVGTGLNGLSEGAGYGDDLQMASNYPLVRLRSGANVFYARTFNWSSTGVQTGATPVSTEFALPAGLPPDNYSLELVANGFVSDPTPFSTGGQGTWTSVGAGLAGLTGIPALNGTGTQQPATAAQIDLTLAMPSSPAVLFVSFGTFPTPFKGGVLFTVPLQLSMPFTTDAGGAVSLPFSWPVGLPSAFSMYYQYAVQDAGAVQGVALSNALRSTTP